jgi:hypothetical protein
MAGGVPGDLLNSFPLTGWHAENTLGGAAPSRGGASGYERIA